MKTIPSQVNETPLIEIENLKTWFPIKRGLLARTIGHIQAVDRVSLKIQRGETVGLVGESGCGKTTLGRTIMGLERAIDGAIFFDQKNFLLLTHNEFRKYRRRIQMIFQDPVSSLNPRMNVLDIITEGLAEFGLIEGNRQQHAIQLLNEVGISEDALYRYPHEFSGGQKQRINIARAISLRPDFIVCDEPVSALDVSVQAQVINLLIDLREAHNLSYLFISHDLSIVSIISHRIIVMYLGRIMETGFTSDMIHHPKHPYTKALISAVPAPGVLKKERIVLKGETPSPSAPPDGCRFHSRCSEVMEVCRIKEPPVFEIDSHQVWCHLYH